MGSNDQTLDAPVELDPSLEDTQASSPIGGEHRGATGTGGSARAPSALTEGTRVGRYLILSRLGAGAMGVVLAAYDPELDRKVAVKLLKPQREERSGARERLQREAQALAKLSHPNVVAVHDVGVHEDAVFVAMEFVDGQTLGQWNETPRTWQEIVAVFAEAGRGLIAAHSAGLVHRDFKPDNVMIDAGGRVRVMDFGLASTRGAEGLEMDASHATTDPDHGEAADVDVSATPLTRTGAVMGTPAYMSPEQFSGVEADARSDQFGFCVAAFEALHGTRPFSGDTFAALLLAVTEGRMTQARNPDVPSWLRRVIERGLATAPEDRWPSMEALVDAMLDDPVARRRRLLVGAGLGGLAVAAGFGLSVAGGEVEPRCPDMRVHLDGVWDADARDAIVTAFGATGLGFADAAAERATANLDAWADRWVLARTQACEATRVRGEVSESLMDLKMACLDDRLKALDAVADVLAEADESMLTRAVQASESLPGLERCADAEALLAEHPPPEDPAVAARVEALETDLARARALNAAGKYPEGTEVVDAVIAEAQSVGYAPFVNRAAAEGAWLHQKKASYERAVELGELAFFGAEEIRQTAVAADASRLLAYSLGYAQHKADEGERWIRHAVALSRATGDTEAISAALATQGTLRFESGNYQAARTSFEAAAAEMESGLGEDDRNYTSVLNNLAMVANALGEFDEARALYERIATLEGRTLGPDHPSIAKTHTNMGLVSYGQGKYEEAREHWEAALAINERGLGPDHPAVADASNNLGALAYKAGDYERALERYGRAIEIRTASLGAEHPEVSGAMLNMAMAKFRMGDAEGALELARESTRLREKTVDPDDPNLAFNYNTLGAMASGAEDWEEARRYHRRAVALREKLGPDHPKLALSLTNLADVEEKTGHLDEAEVLLDRALRIRRAKLDADHPEVATTLLAIGRVALLRGRVGPAIETLERVVEVRDANEPDPTAQAWARFMLAKALWERGRRADRERARELAEGAADVLTRESGAKAEAAPEVRAWLDERGGG